MNKFDEVVKARMVLIDQINNRPEQRNRAEARAKIEGIQMGLKLCGWSDADIGRLVMACDQIQLDCGNDRRMCGGEFLD